MTFDVAVTLGVLALLVFALIKEIAKPAFILFTAILALIFWGVLKPADVLLGFSNTAIATVVLLILIANAVGLHFNTDKVFDKLFLTRNLRFFNLKLTLSAALLSAFFNNASVVALFLPYVKRWSARNGHPASKLLIPLSFAAVLGGIVTVVGTSTTMVLLGLMEQFDIPEFSWITFSLVGISIALTGLLYLNTVGFFILPSHETTENEIQSGDLKYQIAAQIPEKSAIIGRTAIDSGIHIIRAGGLKKVRRSGENTWQDAFDEFDFRAGDQLWLEGTPFQLAEVCTRDSGLTTVWKNQVSAKSFSEQFITENSEWVGKTLDEMEATLPKGAFVGAVYNLPPVHDQTNAELATSKIIQPGDVLLMIGQNGTTQRAFVNGNVSVNRQENAATESSVSKTESVLLLSGIILFLLLAIFGIIKLWTALLYIVFGMAILGLINFNVVRHELDYNLVCTLAFSVVIGEAIVRSGSGKFLSEQMLQVAPHIGYPGLLILLFLTTMLLTSFIPNVASISIMFPVALSVQQITQFNADGLYIAVAIAASLSFVNPVGYHTHMMVYGAGGYRARDFLHSGLPLAILSMAVGIFVIYQFFGR
jgi:di/tricarboxylate transporter